MNRRQPFLHRVGPAADFSPAGLWQPIGWPLLAAVVALLLLWLPLSLAAALLGGATIVLLIFIEPLFGLGLALLLGPFGALENVVLGNSVLDSGQLLLLLTAASWLARSLARRRVMLAQTFLSRPLWLFIAVTAVSLLDAPSLTFGLRELFKWLEIALIIWLVVDLAGARSMTLRQAVAVLLAILLLAGLSQALIGIWQFGLRDGGPDHFLILGRFYRAYGTYEQPNPFGGYMSLNALLAAGTLVGLVMAWLKGETKGTLFQHPLWLLYLTLAAAATLLALLFSWSRGAWLGFAAGFVVAGFFLARRPGLGMAVLVGGFLLLVAAWQLNLIPPAVTARLSSVTADFQFGDVRGVDINDANYAVLERLAHWQAAVDMARDNFWLGVGFGNYEPAYDNYALANWPYPLGHAHNYYLNILAETGLLGTGAYLLFWIAVFWQTVRLLYRLAWPERGIALGLLAAWTALSVHHLVDKLYVNNIYVHLGVMFGLLQLLQRISERQKMS